MTIEELLALSPEPTLEELERHLRPYFPFTRPGDVGNLLLEHAMRDASASPAGPTGAMAKLQAMLEADKAKAPRGLKLPI